METKWAKAAKKEGTEQKLNHNQLTAVRRIKTSREMAQKTPKGGITAWCNGMNRQRKGRKGLKGLSSKGANGNYV